LLQQYIVEISTYNSTNLVNENFNMTAVGPKTITIPQQSVDTVINITIVATSFYNETRVISTKAVFRPATVDAFDSALTMTPTLVAANQQITVQVNGPDAVSVMQQCADTVSFSLATGTKSLQDPTSFVWPTSVATVGNYTLNATYTNGLGTFVINDRTV
jgi:hypothetical protein